MNSRDRAERTLLSLEMACFHAAHSFPGGVEALAALMGCNPQVLRHKLNPNNTSHALQARDVRMIADLTQDDRILQSVCSIFGAGYFRLPQCSSDDATLFTCSSNLVREMSELMETVRTSIADGRVDPEEIQALDKALMELCAEAKTLVEHAKKLGADAV